MSFFCFHLLLEILRPKQTDQTLSNTLWKCNQLQQNSAHPAK